MNRDRALMTAAIGALLLVALAERLLHWTNDVAMLLAGVVVLVTYLAFPQRRQP